MVGSEFDTRGNLFGIYAEDFYESATSQTRLASIDRKTGAATLVGEPMELIVASAINTHDTMYALKALEPDYGVGDVATLYRINTETAQTEVAAADTGLVYTMDMSYDPQGRLWVVGGPRPVEGEPGPGGNLLHTIDTATGVATLQSEITFDASGEPAEIMGIMFDETGKLYGTTFTENSILYKIDPWTGAATPIGNGTGLDYPHGGDYISAVPEPAAFTLTLLGVLCWATGLRRRMAV